MDAKLLAELDLAKGPVPRSDMVEAAVRFRLEFFEDMKRMAERYHQVKASSMMETLNVRLEDRDDIILWELI